MRRTRPSAITALAVALALSFIAGSGPASSQTYPSRSITILVAFPPGGFADSFARLLGNRLSERLGQTVVVENRPGGGGNIAAAAVAKAAADGHTLLVTTNAIAINETLTKNRGFALGDLRAVSISAWAPEVLVVNPKHPARTLAEFVAGAKGKPITYGSPGTGTSGHIVATYFFKELMKMEAVHVPYQGGTPAVNAIMGGHVDVMAGTLVGYASQLQSGAIRGIAVASEKRLPEFPDMPTYADSGFPGIIASGWVGVFLPGRTEEAIATRLNRTIDAAVREPEVHERLKAMQMQTRYGDRASVEALFKEEVANWARMAQAIAGVEK